MLQFFIDGFQINEPSGFTGATFERGTHSKYYGQWNELGLNAGAQNAKIKFTEDKAVNYIKKQVAKYGTKTNVLFKVVDDCAISSCNNIEYKIDISDYSETCCDVEVSFKSVEGDGIRNKMENKVDVVANSTLTIQRFNSQFSTIKGVYLKDAIAQIITKLAPSIEFKSTWLDSCDNIFLTNGYNLRGQDKPLILNLDMIFESINASENIQYSISGNTFRVEKKFTNNESYTSINGDFESITKTINNEMLYANVNIGYKEWQGDPDTSKNEYCSVHHYDTGYSQAKNKLELLSEFITSKYLIEKAITTTEASYNDKIFMIWRDEANTLQFNHHFTPARMVNRHLNYLGLSGDIKFTAGEGNTTLAHADNDSCDGFVEVVENQDFTNISVKQIEGLWNYEFTTKFTIEQFCRLKNAVSFNYCGNTIIAKIKKATFTVNENSSLITIVCNG